MNSKTTFRCPICFDEYKHDLFITTMNKTCETCGHRPDRHEDLP